MRDDLRGESLVRTQALPRLGALEPLAFLMPPRSNVTFFLVADQNSVDDTLVTLGHHKMQDGRATEDTGVISSARRKSEADALDSGMDASR